ncbi:MAG: hypothetical protein J0M33_29005 [Anaerolineae bacterium]|nr:hypothetical protein [Anaerolineae bacterium]
MAEPSDGAAARQRQASLRGRPNHLSRDAVFGMARASAGDDVRQHPAEVVAR